MAKKIALLLVTFCFNYSLIAQQTTIYTEANKAFKNGLSLMEIGVFGKAQTEFQKVIQLLQPVNEQDAELLRIKSELNYAKCAVQLNLPEGEKLILDFIRKYSPDPISNQALVEVANYYYNAKEYDKALEYFSQVPTSGLSKEQRSEVKFRMGYAQFVKKDFSNAKSNFRDIREIENKYYYPTNYYYGLCNFFEGNYSEAIRSFRIVEKSSKYKPHIPFYLTQIYFAERQFNELIAYAEPRLNERNLRKEKEIRQLVGQAYFENGDYKNALPYLEYYADRSSKLREEELYQLGFAQYKSEAYSKAIRSLKELTGVDSELGQYAMYYLADAHLKLGQKADARTALGAAKRMNYAPDLKEEALYNYGKLSYELKDPREAITSLQSLPPQSRYYPEAQKLMAEIFLSYRDYKQAMAIIEKLPNKTPQILESYQKVTYYRGVQLMQEGNLEEAKVHFEKSLQHPYDGQAKALAIYWLGDIGYQNQEYNASIRDLNQFLTLAKTMSGLPDESSLFTANYTQGYNYLKQENYTAALGFFQETVSGIKRNKSFIRSTDVKNQILGDATMRAGDCLFKRNRYNDAVRFYDEAIDQRYSGFVYAIYQKAIIEGLRGRTTDKILALERIPRDFPNSEYADEALLQLGTTYQEIGQLNNAAVPLKELVSKFRGKSDLINQGLIRLGLISYNQGNLETAINYYKQIFSNNPTPGEANLALSALEEIYVDDLGRADEYFAFLETIPGYKLDNFVKDSINFRAAESQFENANYPRAVDSYTNYIRRFSNGRYLLPAYFHRGESYSVLKQYSEALRDYEYVIGRGSSRYFLKALEKGAIIAYNHEQNFAKSYDLYAQLEGAASNEDMRFEAQLGGLRSAYRISNTSAVYNLAGKVANNPNASTAQVSTANFYLGKLAFDNKDYDNALSAFNQVIQNSDNEQTAEARYLKAYIYYLRRDLETAQTLCINANKESSGYPYWVAQSVILLSDVLAEKGDLYNARAALEALLENYNEDPELVNVAQSKLAQINAQISRSSRLNNNPDSKTLEFDNGN